MQPNEGDDGGGWAVNIEVHYYEAIERQRLNYEAQYSGERETSIRDLFRNFQESATSIAHLYKNRPNTSDTGALWIPFQAAAGTVTSLYKESCDGVRRTNELAMNTGYQRRTREFAVWARNKRRRYISCKDLLANIQPTTRIT